MPLGASDNIVTPQNRDDTADAGIDVADAGNDVDEVGTGVEGDGAGVDEPRVHLLMSDGSNRRMLAKWLSSDHTVTTSPTPGPGLTDADLCIVDAASYPEAADAIDDAKAAAEPAFFPVLLLTPDTASTVAPDVWTTVDDVIRAPVRRAVLGARLSSLLRQRTLSTELVRRERELAATIEDLELKERAMDAAPIGVTITDPRQPDNPTVYANEAFERITGYDRADAIGRNMRFLQGTTSDRDAVRAMRSAIDAGECVSTSLLNYRADGSQFWNRVDVAPVAENGDDAAHFVGFQTDVTDEKIREQRLSVLNRLMRHNLSNELNVIGGYADLLLDGATDETQRAYLSQIKSSVTDLEALGRDAGAIGRRLEEVRAYPLDIDLGETVRDVCADRRDEHPALDLVVDVQGGPWTVSGRGLRGVLTELVENAVEHAGGDTPHVEVTVSPADGDTVALTVADDGPGLPTTVTERLYRGEESQLNHGDGLGLWHVYWVTTLLGGDVTFDSDSPGTTVTLTLPVP